MKICRTAGWCRRCSPRSRACSGSSSGATFRDRGTLIERVYDRTGIRLLGLLDLGVLLGSADSGRIRAC